jgi:hypothetical protein
MRKINFVTTGLTLVLSFAGMFFIGSEAFAECKMSREPKLNYFISTQDSFTGMFAEDSYRTLPKRRGQLLDDLSRYFS